MFIIYVYNFLIIKLWLLKILNINLRVVVNQLILLQLLKDGHSASENELEKRRNELLQQLGE